MNSKLTAVLCIPVALLANPHASVQITLGKQACHVFRAPTCWHEVKGCGTTATAQPASCNPTVACRAPDLPNRRQSIDPGSYVFRQGNNRLFIGYEYVNAPSIGALAAAKGHIERFLVSGQEHYEILIDRKPHLRQVSENEWKTQAPFPVTATGAQTTRHFYPETDTTLKSVNFRGRLFPKTGPHFAFNDFNATSISSTQQFITVHSWDGTERTCETILFCGGLPSHGRYWIDLYSVLSGERLIAFTGRYWDLEAVKIFQNTMWLDDRYFIVPLSGDLRTFLLCDLEQVTSAQ